MTELAVLVGLSQSCTTRHLQALQREGLVSGVRAGKRVVFRLRRDEPRVSALLEWALHHPQWTVAEMGADVHRDLAPRDLARYTKGPRAVGNRREGKDAAAPGLKSKRARRQENSTGAGKAQIRGQNPAPLDPISPMAVRELKPEPRTREENPPAPVAGKLDSTLTDPGQKDFATPAPRRRGELEDYLL